MNVRRVFDGIAENLPDNPRETKHAFWVNKADNEIMCPDKHTAATIADLFEEIGISSVGIRYYHPYEDGVNEDCIGWYGICI